LLDQLDQPATRGEPVLRLRPRFAAVDQQNAVGGHAPASERDQAFFDIGW
jgi:hypothetical protein